MLSLGRSPKLITRLSSRQLVVNTKNKAHKVNARRGDGTLGELIPGETPVVDPSYKVARGLTATVEIGVECKILNKAMIKQIDRVMKDLREQVRDFRRGTGSTPLTVAVVGVNHADYTVGYEGSRAWRTGLVEETDPVTGKIRRDYHAHPAEEAEEAIRRIEENVGPQYDELLILRYKATNDRPFHFSWLDVEATQRDYATVLTKISRAYEQRF